MSSVCPICRIHFPATFDAEHRSVHISKCDGVVSADSLEKVLYENSNKAGELKTTKIVAGHSKDTETNSCPVCNKCFAKDATENDRQSHTNKCLDKSIREIPDQEKTDEMLARSLQEQPWFDQQQTNVEVCHICFKDITKLSIQQRLVHVNGCMDKMENIEGKNRRQLPNRRASGRKTKATTTNNKSSVTTRTKRNRNAPKKQCPICGCDVIETELTNHVKQCAKRKKLTNYQFLKVIKENNLELCEDTTTTTDDSTKCVRKTKGKLSSVQCTIRMPNELDILQRTVIEEQREMFNIVAQHGTKDEHVRCVTPSLPASELAIRFQESDAAKNGISNSVFIKNENQHLWNLCSYSSLTKDACFFRKSLHPGIVELHPEPFTATQCEKLEDLLHVQTEENETDNDGSFVEKNERNGFITDDTEEKMLKKQDEAHSGVLTSLQCLLESSKCTDFTFHCNGKVDVHAHKLILMLRCDALKKLIEGGESTADVTLFSSTIVSLLLMYLYCGTLPTCSAQDCKALYTLATRFEIEFLAEVCLLLHPDCNKECQRPANGHGDMECYSVDELISTFWQQEEGNGGQCCDDNVENDEKCSDNDSCFSNEEMGLIREIFQSQHIKLSLPVKKACEENLPSKLISETDKTISLSINKTIEKPTTVDSQSECKADTLPSGILGESPNLQFKSPSYRAERDNKKAETYQWASSSFLPPPNRVSRKTSKTESLSSLEALPSNSMKTFSSGTSRTQSFSSHLSGGSAFADTLPIDSGDSYSDKTEVVRRESFGLQTTNQVELNDSEMPSRRNHLHNVMMLEFAKLGNTNFLNGKIPTKTNDFRKIDVYGEKYASGKRRDDVIAQGSQGIVLVNKNDSPLDLFEEKSVGNVSKQQDHGNTNSLHRETFSKETHTDKTIDTTPMVLSCETPCLPNETPSSTKVLDNITTHTLGEEKTISTVYVSKTEKKDEKHENKISVIEDSGDDTHPPDVRNESTQSYEADFCVTDTIKKLLNDDPDLQETTMEVSKVSPCVAQRDSLPLLTSTPYVAGSTKKEYLLIRKKLNTVADSSTTYLGSYQNNNNNNNSNDVDKTEVTSKGIRLKDPSPVEQSPKKQAVSIVIVDSPKKENVKRPQKYRKRKIISSSSENLSSGCESRNFGMNIRKPKKYKRLNEMFPARKMNIAQNNDVSSCDGDDDEVSESDGPLFSPQLRSTFKGTPSRKKRRSTRKTTKTPSPSWRNKDTPPSKSGSPWLLAKNLSPRSQKKRIIKHDGDNDDCEDKDDYGNDEVDIRFCSDPSQLKIKQSILKMDVTIETLSHVVSGNNTLDVSQIIMTHDGDKRDESQEQQQHIKGKVDDEEAFDAPYCDDNDMYFMDDGGYNSFIMEMSPGEKSQHQQKVHTNEEDVTDTNVNANTEHIVNKQEETDLNKEKEILNKDRECLNKDGESLNEDRESLNKDGKSLNNDRECLNKDGESLNKNRESRCKDTNIVDFEQNSFDIEMITMETNSSVVRTADISCNLTTENATPAAKCIDSKTISSQTPVHDDHLVRQACKHFQVGGSTHPQSNEPITPMPNFAQLPTPELKDKIKKMALRQLPKEKMVSKLIEVYKYQHDFPHWEEDAVKTKRKTRKTTKKQESISTVENEAPTNKKNKKTTTTKVTSTASLCSSNENKKSAKNDNNTFQGEETQTQSFDEDGTEEAIGSKTSNVKKTKPPLSTEQDLFAFIKSDVILYQKILSFQPIEGNTVYGQMKNASINVTRKVFDKFLDDQCICTKKDETQQRRRTRKR